VWRIENLSFSLALPPLQGIVFNTCGWCGMPSLCWELFSIPARRSDGTNKTNETNRNFLFGGVIHLSHWSYKSH